VDKSKPVEITNLGVYKTFGEIASLFHGKRACSHSRPWRPRSSRSSPRGPDALKEALANCEKRPVVLHLQQWLGRVEVNGRGRHLWQRGVWGGGQEGGLDVLGLGGHVVGGRSQVGKGGLAAVLKLEIEDKNRAFDNMAI
jgi:hypothetical protein